MSKKPSLEDFKYPIKTIFFTTSPKEKVDTPENGYFIPGMYIPGQGYIPGTEFLPSRMANMQPSGNVHATKLSSKPKQ